MDLSKDHTAQAPELQLYEYQAVDKLLNYVRGQVRATSKSDARKKIKAGGMRPNYTWVHGKHPWLISATKSISEALGQPKIMGMKLGTHKVPLFTLQSDDTQVLLYIAKHKWFRLAAAFFGPIGVMLVVLHFRDVLSDMPVPLFLIIGCGFVAIALILALVRIELSVERTIKKIFKRISVIPNLWRCQVIDGSTAEHVLLHQEYYIDEGYYKLYTVSVAMSDQRVEVDSSSSMEAQFDMAKRIAEYLNVPFKNEMAD